MSHCFEIHCCAVWGEIVELALVVIRKMCFRFHIFREILCETVTIFCNKKIISTERVTSRLLFHFSLFRS